jgi:hypothetical protein
MYIYKLLHSFLVCDYSFVAFPLPLPIFYQQLGEFAYHTNQPASAWKTVGIPLHFAAKANFSYVHESAKDFVPLSPTSPLDTATDTQLLYNARQV